jgi:hypothetical protein
VKTEAAYRTLEIVDGTQPLWLEEVVKKADKKRNFVVILKDPEDLKTLCNTLECDPEELPERLQRWGIHAMSEVLETSDYRNLLSLYRHHDIRLIEQLNLARNRPPKVKPFILYCEVRGIISDHDNVESACTALLDYLDAFTRARHFPLAGIYEHTRTGWKRVKEFRM